MKVLPMNNFKSIQVLVKFLIWKMAQPKLHESKVCGHITNSLIFETYNLIPIRLPYWFVKMNYTIN